MSPQKAVQICEKDLACAGFGYKGPIITDDRFEGEFWIYFHHYIFPTVLSKRESALWTTYKVTSRDFIRVPSRPVVGKRIAPTDAMITFKTAVDNENYSDAIWPSGEFSGISFNNGAKNVDDDDDAVIVLRSVILSELVVNRPNTTQNWYTFIRIEGKRNSSPGNDVSDGEVGPWDVQCPIEKKEDAYLANHFHVDNIQSVACDISPDEFHTKFVRRSVPVKLVGCQSSTQGRSNPWKKKAILNLMAEDQSRKCEVLLSTNEKKWNRNSISLDIAKVKPILKKGLPYQIRCPLSDKQSPLGDLLAQDWLPEVFHHPASEDGDVKLTLDSQYTGSFPSKVSSKDTVVHLLQGEQRWVLFPPESQLYLEHISCSQTEERTAHNVWTPVSWYNHLYPQVIRFPWCGRKIVSTILKPGETLYVPSQVPKMVYQSQASIAIEKALHMTLNGLLGGSDWSSISKNVLGKLLNGLEGTKGSPQHWDTDLWVIEQLHKQAEQYGQSYRVS
ncbi:hypothetical protein TCAL_16549 [Tigriopus californicus]|uniref:JmjC domain-containing protein n=1 Tax=Tigriopus californicus TaxID=6832 RepID=A0A553NBB4_TIGCA|nr:hypothetical protein TCAL_16549 [Tigriopus californicus]